MDYKEAINILLKILDKDSLGENEKEAVLTAVGVLSWASLGKSRSKKIAKNKKEKQKKDAEW